MIRIEAAIARAKENGRTVKKKEIAARLWPNSTEVAQQVNMTRLCSGKTPRIGADWPNIICEMTGVSADFLFGLTND